MIEAPFEMANLFSQHTGLPFVVWISYKGAAKQALQVKVSRSRLLDPADIATVTIWPEADPRAYKVSKGRLDRDQLELLKAWIEQNCATLVSYWEGDIDTQDALEALTKV